MKIFKEHFAFIIMVIAVQSFSLWANFLYYGKFTPTAGLSAGTSITTLVLVVYYAIVKLKL